MPVKYITLFCAECMVWNLPRSKATDVLFELIGYIYIN